MRVNAIATVVALAAVAAFGTTGCQDLGEPIDETPEPPKPPDPAPEVEPLGPDFDFTNAIWSLANVSRSPSTLSHDGQLAFIDRHTVAVFSEPEPTDFGDQDIHRAVRSGDDWVPETMTLQASTQLAFPTIASSEGNLWFSWTGRDAAESDLAIWVRREQLGGNATEAVNITSELPLGTRQSYESRLVPRAGGGADILYLSHAGAPGQPASGHEVRVQTVAEDGSVGSASVVLEASCRNLRAVVDAAGKGHAVAICSGLATPLVYFVREKSGWTSVLVPLGETRGPTVADIGVDSAGLPHIVWAGSMTCGEETCRRVFASKGLGAAVTIGNEPGFMPVIAVDPYDRPVVAFHRTGDSPAMMVSHSKTSSANSFERPKRIATSEDRDTSASQLIFDADGRPHLLFDRIYSGTSPLNGEVTHATIR